MNTAQGMAARYVAIWNETDAEARHAALASLWRPDIIKGCESRYAAPEHGIIIGSDDKTIGERGYRFRARPGAERLRDVIAFTWEMMPADADTVLARGLEFLVLNPDGRIITDYQFIAG